jgi:hypothetical protein
MTSITYKGPSGDVNDLEAIARVNKLRAMSAVPVALYADGGLIGHNPSSIGGTWAWCQVDKDGQRIKHASGIVTPEQVGGPVTNNVTELLALVEGLESLPAIWNGAVYSDSLVTLLRVFQAGKLANVPRWLCQRLWAVQRTGALALMTYTLLDGHPTKAQLESGVGKRGNPVSIHNVWADQECGRLAKEAKNAK